MSLQIQALENEIGVKLFERDRSKTVLTAAGTAFQREATGGLGAERSPEPEEAFHALARLLSRWLLARAEYPELESLRLFAKIRANVANQEQFLDNQGTDI